MDFLTRQNKTLLQFLGTAGANKTLTKLLVQKLLLKQREKKNFKIKLSSGHAMVWLSGGVTKLDTTNPRLPATLQPLVWEGKESRQHESCR